MKNIIVTSLSVVVFLITFSVQAQDKLKDRDLIGNWKLIIDVEDAFDEAQMELEEEGESALGRIVLSSVSGLVTGLLDEIEIYMEFLPKGDLKVVVEAFGEKEIEYSSWKIDDKGRLFIEDTDSYSSDINDFWILKDGVLMSYNDQEGHIQKNVYMIKLD